MIINLKFKIFKLSNNDFKLKEVNCSHAIFLLVIFEDLGYKCMQLIF